MLSRSVFVTSVLRGTYAAPIVSEGVIFIFIVFMFEMFMKWSIFRDVFIGCNLPSPGLFEFVGIPSFLCML